MTSIGISWGKDSRALVAFTLVSLGPGFGD